MKIKSILLLSFLFLSCMKMIAQEITQKEVNNLYNQMKKEEGKLQRAQKTCDDVAEKLEQAKADVNLAQIESDNAQKAFEEADRKFNAGEDITQKDLKKMFDNKNMAAKKQQSAEKARDDANDKLLQATKARDEAQKPYDEAREKWEKALEQLKQQEGITTSEGTSDNDGKLRSLPPETSNIISNLSNTNNNNQVAEGIEVEGTDDSAGEVSGTEADQEANEISQMKKDLEKLREINAKYISQ